ncbi:neutral zinc metallopeptidase [Roseisolibacter agri]|uniref:Neutral zinc metallopeptidase n=1 Tax=Roseisolibacter agri TaxID=2014610 RepID=A0AA37V5A6_9BACT|nr:neutral zinc metallopeptidase [Roseisolibacter agri]GLC23891.1 neutral zinc metallopeptidase [Roseisolibacter agri]
MTTRSVLLHARTLVAAALVAGLTTAAAPDAPLPLQRMGAGDTPTVTVTLADVQASNAKAAMAYGALVPMWRAHFADVGARFVAPQVARFRGAGVRTPCGAVTANNAAYCPRDNRIYFDEIFLAAQAKRAAMQLGTDGDMAAVGVIAHEMGHAVAIQLGQMSRYTYQNERTADCLAGAFARQADADGQLEPGDIDEAFFGMAAAADPTPELTGDRRADRAILVRAALMGHGTEAQRTANFRAGLESGPGACLEVFRDG